MIYILSQSPSLERLEAELGRSFQIGLLNLPRSATVPKWVPIWGPGSPWGPFWGFGSPLGPHFMFWVPFFLYFRLKNAKE